METKIEWCDEGFVEEDGWEQDGPTVEGYMRLRAFDCTCEANHSGRHDSPLAQEFRESLKSVSESSQE